MLLSLQAMQAEHWAPDGPHHQPAAEPSQEQGAYPLHFTVYTLYTLYMLPVLKGELAMLQPLVSTPSCMSRWA